MRNLCKSLPMSFECFLYVMTILDNDALRSIMNLLTRKAPKTGLQLGFSFVKITVIMIVGVNGGDKTTSLGNLANRLKKEGAKILMAAGDTFRAAASDQLEIWTERTGCEIFVAAKGHAKAASGIQSELMEHILLMKVSVVDELGIPVKFVGVGEWAEDLQPFDAKAFVNAIFPRGNIEHNMVDETILTLVGLVVGNIFAMHMNMKGWLTAGLKVAAEKVITRICMGGMAEEYLMSLKNFLAKARSYEAMPLEFDGWSSVQLVRLVASAVDCLLFFFHGLQCNSISQMCSGRACLIKFGLGRCSWELVCCVLLV
ncbi:hypothetical protein ACH5RR_000228 [Cinchona calisaya]|uniref:SRP54-type proteins GTP-binding domain-containing protein n=1 Tax=Cinchona calisaya TaxID=153742 RepID=A0ABD3B111_9GENT